MHFLQAINSDLSVLIVCNKTGGTIKGDIKKDVSSWSDTNLSREITLRLSNFSKTNFTRLIHNEFKHS